MYCVVESHAPQICSDYTIRGVFGLVRSGFGVFIGSKSILMVPISVMITKSSHKTICVENH